MFQEIVTPSLFCQQTLSLLACFVRRLFISSIVLLDLTFDHSFFLLKQWNPKKKLPYDPKEVPKEKRFRANLSDAFLSGDLSGQRSHSLFADAMDAGAHNVSDLAGNHEPNGNSARDLTGRLLKAHQWPQMYWTSIPCWSDKEQPEKEELVPFLLPHEILHQFSEYSDVSQFRNLVLQRGADILQTEAEQLLPLDATGTAHAP